MHFSHGTGNNQARLQSQPKGISRMEWVEILLVGRFVESPERNLVHIAVEGVRGGVNTESERHTIQSRRNKTPLFLSEALPKPCYKRIGKAVALFLVISHTAFNVIDVVHGERRIAAKRVDIRRGEDVEIVIHLRVGRHDRDLG